MCMTENFVKIRDSNEVNVFMHVANDLDVWK